jgi:hypothetical protein
MWLNLIQGLRQQTLSGCTPGTPETIKTTSFSPYPDLIIGLLSRIFFSEFFQEFFRIFSEQLALNLGVAVKDWLTASQVAAPSGRVPGLIVSTQRRMRERKPNTLEKATSLICFEEYCHGLYRKDVGGQ